MTAQELREKYLKFFESKGHTIIPSASLVPRETDGSTLFTTAGMHPLVPYLLGEEHPGGKRVASVQKCVRTGDIDDVGDATHHTFFEMLGNWSFGDYFKEESIKMSWEFLTSLEWLGLDKNRIAVSVFEGDDDSPFDEEAHNIWKEIFEKNNLPIARIAKLPKKNNWWGMEKGPCGPDSEMFFWAGDADKIPESFNDDNDLWVEIWNNVFMEFNKSADGKYEKLKQTNVDTGMGFERTLAALNGFDDNYRTELFWPIIEKIEKLSSKSYQLEAKSYRIIADHIKASTFIISEGIEPLNVGRGYVLRRLIRRAVRYGKLIGIEKNFIKEIAEVVIEMYKNFYPELEKNKDKIFEELEKEENKFGKTLEKGLSILNKLYPIGPKKLEEDEFPPVINKDVDPEKVFDLYQTYGFPFEMIQEELNKRGLRAYKEEFERRLEKHQELSRTASAGMFKGGLQDASEQTVKLHTAAHLLLAALRQVLGNHVVQKGSNITAERLRFDFSHSEKMMPEQIEEVEKLVNGAIAARMEVIKEEMPLEEARKINAMGVFDAKYGDKVLVYSIANEKYQLISREICGGPHVENTGELGHFKIQKEESSSAGVRRIKAVLE